MNGSIKLYKSDGKGKKGFPIKLILNYKGKDRRKTFAYSDIENWNEKDNMPRITHPQYDDLYVDILEYKKRIMQRDFEKIVDFKKAFDYVFKYQNDENINPCFYRYAEKRINYMKSINRSGNANAYEFSTDQLKSFRSEIFFNDISRSLIVKFIEHKKKEMDIYGERKVKNVSIRTYIRSIRAIYNSMVIEYDLQDKEPFNKIMQLLPIQRRRASNTYVGYNELKILKESELSLSQQRAVDLFILQFYLGGQSLIDVYYLKWDQIHNDRVYFERIKLGEKKEEFDVKLFDCAFKIISKLSESKKGHIFPWRKDRTGYITFRDNHGRNLKKAFEKLQICTLPKNEKPNSKTPRHTFQTLAKFKFIDPDIIREIVGHERSDVDTVYKDKFPEKVRDDAHWKIIDINENV